MTKDEAIQEIEDKDYITEHFNDACKFCQNNPNNGGTGICNCVLGSPVIY